MAAAIRFGSIVWTEMADANGIRKARPVVVVTPDDRIAQPGEVDVVAITSRLSDPLPGDYVQLPWHAQGHPRTGLNRKSAAVCSWVARVSTTDISNVAGLISGPVLLTIMSKILPAPP